MIQSLAIRALLAVIAVAVAFTAGFYSGYEWAAGKQAIVEVKQQAAEKKDEHKVQAAEAKSDHEAGKRKAARAVQREQVLGEVAKHAATTPDTKECALAPERVKSINQAWGFDSADAAQGAPSAQDKAKGVASKPPS